jgi:hypothetical protein
VFSLLGIAVADGRASSLPLSSLRKVTLLRELGSPCRANEVKFDNRGHATAWL